MKARKTVFVDPIYTDPGQLCTVMVSRYLHCQGSKLFCLAVPFTLYRYNHYLMVEPTEKHAGIYSDQENWFTNKCLSKNCSLNLCEHLI